MASIKGLTVKKVVHFKGHEGEPLTQCEVYYKGKNVGYFSNGDWGSANIVRVDAKVEEVFKDYLSKWDEAEKYKFYGVEYAIQDVLDMLDNEKTFKKNVKQGYEGFVRVTEGGWKCYILYLTKEMAKMDKDTLDKHIKGIFARQMPMANRDALVIDVYDSIEMFTIN